jgi:hypothetical protein
MIPLDAQCHTQYKSQCSILLLPQLLAAGSFDQVSSRGRPIFWLVACGSPLEACAHFELDVRACKVDDTGRWWRTAVVTDACSSCRFEFLRGESGRSNLSRASEMECSREWRGEASWEEARAARTRR